jgi:small subunit ribosomal protein S16
VVADSEAPRGGKFLERVGTYDPKENPARFQVDEQLTLRWLRKGAQPTETVKSLLKKAGIWKKYLDEKREKPAVA